MEAILCRNDEQIADDTLAQCHDNISRALNRVANGKCVYLGDARRRLVDLRAEAERHILAGTRPMDIYMFSMRVSYALSHPVK